MANLLDRSSLVLTPTAYNNGEALCIKPDDASGDFTFSRNSAATRVNAQGLVENVQILSSNLVQNGDFSEEGVQEVSNGSFSQEGAELVTNGDFATDLSGWNNSNNYWQWSSQGAYFPLTTTHNPLIQVITSNASAVLKFTFTLTIVQGTANVYYQDLNNASVSQQFTQSGTYTIYTTPVKANTSINFSRYGGINTEFYIDNVSVREVGQDWTLGTGWSIGEDKAICDGSGRINPTNNSWLSGKTYKFDIEVSDRTAGYFRIQNPAVSIYYVNNINSNGTYTYYINTIDANGFVIEAVGFDGSITNISVKEVGMDWGLNNWSVGDSLVSSGISSFLVQSNVYTSTTNIYKTTFRARSVSGTSVTLRLYDGADNYETFTITSSEFQNFELTRQRQGTNSILYLYNNSNAEIEITNIKIIEITTDTSLPRINYEGFSYQDALGSEEIVNGDGSSTIGWNVAYSNTTLSINNNNLRATANASGAYGLSQILSLDTSKQYLIKATINVDNASGSTANLRVATSSNLGSGVTNLSNATGTSTTIFTPSASTMYIGIVDTADNSSNFVEIDNVSVKEYLGQEVVPDSGCGSWLFESQSTNLITQSELFSDASWVKSRSTYTSDAVKSPSGLINMGYLTEDTTATNTHYMRTFLTLTDGVDYTLSVFAKAKERNIICLGDNAAAQSNTGVWFDLTNGVVLTQRSGYVGSIKDFGNGIYRCSVIYSAAAARQYADIAISLSDGVNVYTGDGTSGVYIWGAMLEENNISSYIPTEGSTNTRNQDLCTNGGSLASINSTSGTLYFEGAALANDLTDRDISISDGTNNNVVRIRISRFSNNIGYAILSNGVTTGGALVSGQTQTNTNKIAVKYKQDDFALWVNGVEVATDTSGNTPIGLSSLQFTTGNVALPFFGKTKALAVWKEALSDSELQSLTTI